MSVSKGSITAIDVNPEARVAVVGSRRSPREWCDHARRIGAAIVRQGGVIISGGAPGIDQAAISGGASEDPKRCIVLLPWTSFEREQVPEGVSVWPGPYHPHTRTLARKAVRGWDSRSRGARATLTRNAGICRTSDIMIAYPGGGGGTEHAMRCMEILGRTIVKGTELNRVGNEEIPFRGRQIPLV